MSERADLLTAGSRARGLATHLLGRSELEAYLGSDLPSLAERLGRRLGDPEGGSPTAPGIAAMVRRGSARLLRTLSRWPGSRPALEVFEGEQDRRSLRALTRGAIQGATQDQRLAGLLPTRRLPERALTELAAQPTVGQVVGHLVLLQHPDAESLIPAASRPAGNLLELELALVRGLASRSARAARNGDRNLQAFVERRIDVGNAETALALASSANDLDPDLCFVEGGAFLPRAAFLEVSRAGGQGLAPIRLGQALADTPLSPLAGGEATNPSRLERASLENELSLQRRAMRLDPLGSSPTLSFLLRVEAQAMDLCRLAWGAALGAPARALRPELVTPWR